MQFVSAFHTIQGEDDDAALQRDLDRLSARESMWKCKVVQVTARLQESLEDNLRSSRSSLGDSYKYRISWGFTYLVPCHGILTLKEIISQTD